MFEQEQNIITDGHFWNLEQKNHSEVEINEKEQTRNAPSKDLVFEASNIDGDDHLGHSNLGQTKTTVFQANDTRNTKFSSNPFEPKRRTRKFKQAGKTKDNFAMTISKVKDNDEISEDFYIE